MCELLSSVKKIKEVGLGHINEKTRSDPSELDASLHDTLDN